MTSVYILQNAQQGRRFYVGITRDLRARLQKHNAGEVPHTSKHIPWTIKTCVAFTGVPRARAFETYLKSVSGRALSKRHFRSKVRRACMTGFRLRT